MNQHFGKKYKLCSKKIIDKLFREGNSIYHHPFTIIYTFEKLPIENVLFQIVISVSKKKFKKAVDRNNIKRLIRESFRKNKYILENLSTLKLNKNKQLALFLNYSFNKKLKYKDINQKTIKLLTKLAAEIEKK
jgi:ribonuclease P protein component